LAYFLGNARRQYAQEAHRIGIEEMSRVVGETWKSLSAAEKQPYEQVAQQEMGTFLQSKRVFEGLHRQYSQLHYAAQEAGARACPLTVRCVSSSGILSHGNSSPGCLNIAR
jgi:hypothetical protein